MEVVNIKPLRLLSRCDRAGCTTCQKSSMSKCRNCSFMRSVRRSLKALSTQRGVRRHDNATLSYVTFSRRHLEPSAATFRSANRAVSQWSCIEDDHPAQAWQHHEQHRDRAPRGPETPPPQGRCSSSIFRAGTRTTRRTKRENTPPRRREKNRIPKDTVLRTAYLGKPYCDNIA